MVDERSRCRARRLGLVRPAARRRPRADVLPPAPQDGASEPWSRGSLVAAGGHGSSRTLQPEEILATPLSTWKSPSGAVYPGRWRLQLPGEALDLELTPRVAAQELAATVRYWEGAVKVAGSSHGRPVGGHGFVEMTGYGSAGAR